MAETELYVPLEDYLRDGCGMSAASERSIQQKLSFSGTVSLATIVGSLTAVLIVILTSARGFLDPLVFNIVVVAFAAAILTLVAFHFVARPLSPLIQKSRRKAQQESIPAVYSPISQMLLASSVKSPGRWALVGEVKYARKTLKSVQHTPDHEAKQEPSVAMMVNEHGQSNEERSTDSGRES